MFTGLKLAAVPFLPIRVRGLIKFGAAIRAARRRLPESPVIVDIGANVGEFSSVCLLAWQKAQVYSCEPIPQAYRRLKRVLGRSPRAHAFECAVAAAPGQKTLRVSSYDPASSFYELNPAFYDLSTAGREACEITVQCVTLADFINREVARDVDWIKIDTEGAELEVLATIGQVRHNIRAFQIELAFQQIYHGSPLIHDVMTFMDKQGYRMIDLYGRNENRRGVVIGADGFFVRKSDS